MNVIPPQKPTPAESTERHPRTLMTVDFVTAFSVDDCRQWLAYAADQIDTQRVEIWEDNSFTIRCCCDSTDPFDDSGARTFEVRFWGTLEPHTHGTWVWGTSIEDPNTESSRFGFPPTFVVIILFTLAIEAYLREADTMMWLWLGSLGALGVWSVISWWEQHRRTLRVILWIWETLYVQPPKGKPAHHADEEPSDAELYHTPVD